MKTVAIVALVLSVLVIVGHVLAQGPPSVEQASATLATTEHHIAAAIKTSTTTADVITKGLESPTTLSHDLDAFARATQDLERLVTELEKEIIAYDAARSQQLAAFQQELGPIHDPAARAHLKRLLACASTTSARRLARSRQALTALRRIVRRGADVTHAAKCVVIAHDLDLQGNDLHEQVAFTRAQAAEYEHLTNTLLTKLTAPRETTE